MKKKTVGGDRGTEEIKTKLNKKDKKKIDMIGM